MTLSATFAGWVTGLRFDDLPEPVVAAAVESIRDTVACAVLGGNAGRMGGFASLMNSVAAPPTASVVLGAEASVVDAACYNAICAHGSELDDTLLGAGGHPGAVVVPVALALAEAHGLGGRDVITAVVAGYELLYRTVAPIFPGNQQRGFQATGLGGPFAATASAAVLLGLDAGTTQQAFGIAGGSASGLLEYDQTGGETKRLYAGLAARAGVEAVQLARAGVTGPSTIFEGRRGVFTSFGDGVVAELATDGLGSDFSILSKRRVKRYPTVGSFHGALDALGAVLDGSFGRSFGAAEIERIDVFLAPLSVVHGGAVTVPTDMVSAQFGCAYSVALRVLFGHNDLELYENDALWSDPRVLAVLAKVFVWPDDRLDPLTEQGRGRVAVRLTDGRLLENDQPVPAGRPDNPLPAAEFDERFVRFTRALGPAAQQELDTLLCDLPFLDSVRGIAGTLRTTQNRKGTR